MAQAEYMIQVKADCEAAIKCLDTLAEKQKGVGAAVDDSEKKTGKLNTKMIAFGATMVATAGSVIFMGASLETAMFKSSAALAQAGVAADELAASLNEAGRAASELLPVAAQFARFGIAADQIEGVTLVAQDMGDVLGKSAKETGAALSQIAAAAGLKTKPQIEALASGLTVLERAYPGVYDANVKLLQTLGPTAAQFGISAASLTGASTAMTNFGVSAGDAQSFLSEFVNATQFGPDVVANLGESLGLSGAELAKFADESTNSTEKMKLLFAGMKNTDPVTMRHRLMELAGVSGASADAMIRMAHEGKTVAEVMDMAAAGFKDGTGLVKAHAEWSETLNGALSALWRQLRAVGQETGKALVPIMWGLVKVLQFVVGIVGMVPSPIRALVIAFLGLTGVVFTLQKLLKNDLVVGFLDTAKSMWGYVKAVIVGTAKTLSFVGALILERAEMAFVRAEQLFHTAVMKSQNAVYAAARGIKMAFVAVTQSEILATVLATAKKWLMVAAQGALNVVMLIGKGIFLGVGIVMGTMATMAIGAATALWGMAVAAWAAIAPLLPFIAIGALIVAAVVAVGAAIYFLVKLIADNWVTIWTTARNVVVAAWDGLVALWGIVVQVGSAVFDALVYPFKLWWQIIMGVWGAIASIGSAVAEFLIAPIRAFWNLLVTAFDSILAPFQALWSILQDIGGVIGSVVGMIFGSSMFHLKEGVAEVMPSLRQMEGAFNAVGQAAGKVGLESHIPDDIRVRVGEPLGRMGTGRETGLSEGMSGKQAFGGVAGSGAQTGIDKPTNTKGSTGAGEGTSGGGGVGRIVVPVTIKLDNEVLARAVQEYEMNAGRERYMNAPSGPLRGAGG